MSFARQGRGLDQDRSCRVATEAQRYLDTKDAETFDNPPLSHKLYLVGQKKMGEKTCPKSCPILFSRNF